jgi:hypothetical protein
MLLEECALSLEKQIGWEREKIQYKVEEQKEGVLL